MLITLSGTRCPYLCLVALVYFGSGGGLGREFGLSRQIARYRLRLPYCSTLSTHAQVHWIVKWSRMYEANWHLAAANYPSCAILPGDVVLRVNGVAVDKSWPRKVRGAYAPEGCGVASPCDTPFPVRL